MARVVTVAPLMSEIAKARGIRWRWAIGILFLATVALVVIWSLNGSRQDHVLQSMITGLATLTILFLWAVLFSRFQSRTRLVIFFAGVVIGGGLASSMEISGVTGDLVPILRWKWKARRSVGVTKPGELKTNGVASVSFPQFLGPERNGILRGIRLETNWTARPPRELWRHAVGPAWSGFVIANGIAVTQEQQGDQEFVNGYELETGKLIWSHADLGRYNTTIAGEGPRATPTIANGRVYSFGGTGILNCLDLASGQMVWTKNLAQEHSVHVPEWGFASAPLVYDGLAIVNIGGKNDRSLVAHEAKSGKFVWGGGDESAGYSSPTVMELCGVKQAVVFNHSAVAGHDLRTGKVLWSHPSRTSTPHCAMPIQVATNRAMASQGYGYGSELMELSETNGNWTVERAWKSNRLKSKFANLILHKGLVYGLDDGILVCFDPQTGERKWQGERHGHGQLLLVEDVILLMAENGEILLVELTPAGERVAAWFRALTSKTWNPPALAGQYLLVRNDLEAACFKLPLASDLNPVKDRTK
jgi:outer membrane protein assembly factor BamB